MTTDLYHRMVLIAVAAMHLGLSRRYLGRANAGATLFQRRAEGWPLTLSTGATYVAYSAFVLVYLVNPQWMSWSALAVPGAFRWAGAVVMALGAGLHLWGMHHLGTNLTISISPRQGHTLVTSGPFRWIRHPLYVGGMVESLGVCLLLSNGAVALCAAGFWGFIALRTYREEEELVTAFGEDYRAYQKQVGRFVPGWIRSRD